MKAFNQSPYFDDYDENKKFVRILFNPAVAVQARELTQMQTMIQSQIGRFGKHVFVDGSRVIDAQTSFETKSISIKTTATDVDLGTNISNIFTYFDIDTTLVSLDYLKKIITTQGYLANRDGVSGLTFTNGNARLKVVAVFPLIDVNNPMTVICQEMTGATASNNTTYTASTGKTFTSIATDAVSGSSFYSINSGVFFVNELFVYVNKQTVITSKYNSVPSIRVGLTIEESIINSDIDKSLLDPARDSTNFNASGADRYAIDLILTTKAFDSSDPVNNTSSTNYVELARIENGIIAAQRESSTYSDLEDNLARRTYDESGDYTVRPFRIQFREHPTDGSKFQIGLDAGVAYIRGYEFRTLSTTWLDAPKARTTASTTNEVIPTLFGNFVDVDSSVGVVNGNLPVLTQDVIQLWNATTGGTQVGTAKVRQLYRTSSTKYRIYLTDISMSSGTFDTIRSIRYTGGVHWDVVVDSGSATLNESSSNVLLFRQPHENVKTFGSTDYNYIKVSSISAGQWSGSGPYTITTISPSSGEVFATPDSANGYAPYVVIDSTGTVRSITNVTIGGGGTLTLSVSAGAGNPSDSTLYSLMKRTTATPRIKTLNTNTVTVNAGVGVTNFKLSSGSRNYYDGTEVVSIFHSSAPVTDIKNKFKFDGGQTDNYYGVANVTWNDASAIATTGTFTITFKSFDHSNDSLGSGYFNVDSYTNVTVENIPVYKSPTTGAVFNLKDVIDFRPTVSDTVGSSLMKPQGLPVPFGIGAEFTTDYEYYLPRKDKVVLTKDKKFIVLNGIPSVSAIYPNDSPDGMTLYGVMVPSFTSSTTDIKVDYIENKRYTMRDIGKIEKRIDRVEYYTALSLLEKQAKDSTLLTSTGVNAFKNGILVDSFVGHSVGDVSNPEYKCSIDYRDKVLRPRFDIKNIKFNRVSGGVVSSDGIITLPYTVETFIDQPLASNIVNVTPYDTISWIGSTKLIPSSDTWYDTEVAPDLILDDTNVNDNWVALQQNAVGTVWNAWVTDWVGVDETRTTDSQTRLTTVVSVPQQHISRTGMQTTVTPVYSTISSNKVINTSVIPFMRQIQVGFVAKFLKPLTRIYAFFDSVPVNTGITMTTDEFGEYNGTFTIPSGIRTGTKLLTISDKPTLTEVPSTTAVGQFSSSGTLDTLQSTRLRSLSLSSSIVRQDDVVLGTPTVTTIIDPLAESFFVNAREFPNGVFIDSIWAYFHSKSSTLPVMMQIRPMVNGYPSSIDILPLSELTLNPSQVNIVADPFNPTVADKTEFKFSSPIHLPVGEYCFVMLATTTEYQVYSAIMGAKQLGSNNVISKQPYIGSMFKSQNASTWTASQESDLMFRINKCKFDTTTASTVVLSNVPTSESTVFPYHVVNAFNSTQEFSVARTTWKQRGVVEGGTLESTWTDINNSTNIDLVTAYQIQPNLTNQLQYQVTLASSNSDVSPVLDLERCSSVLVKNIVNTDISNETSYNAGNALAKYMHRKVTLANDFASNGLSVTFDANLPSIADVYVYYKAIDTGTNSNFETTDWVLLGSTGNASQTPAKRLDTSSQFVEYTLKTSLPIPLFNMYSVKLVMVGNGINYPEIKDLRVIAYS